MTNQKKGSDYSKFFFEIVPAEKRIMKIGDRVSSIFKNLFDFYGFLQTFGMKLTKNKQNEDIMIYSYEISLHMETLLKLEVSNLFESLENLKEFLGESKEKKGILDYKLKQSALKDQKIVEILLSISVLVDTLMYGSKNSNFHKENLLKLRTKDNFSSVNPNIIKTPFEIAKKNLENVIRKIYEILFYCIKDNSESSQFILEYNDFLSVQLRYYKNEVSELLIEAIRCSKHVKGDENNVEQVINFNNYLIINYHLLIFF